MVGACAGASLERRMRGNDTTREIKRLIREASASREAGDGAAEDRALLRCIELDDGEDRDLRGEPDLPPFRLRPYLSYADALLNRGDAVGALRILDPALARWPSDADAHLLAAMCRRALKQWEAAESALRRSFELDARAYTCIFLAQSLDKLGRVQEARWWLRHSLVVDPNYEESHFNLGHVLEQEGDIEAAIESYRRAVELDRDYALAHARLGSLLLARAMQTAPAHEQPDWSLAFDHLERATKIDPDDRSSHAQLATMCEVTERFDEAEMHRRAATRRHETRTEQQPD